MQLQTFPKVVAIVPSMIASCQIGVIKPLMSLAAKGKIRFDYCLEGKASLNAINSADLVVFCRNTEPAYSHLLNQAVATHKPIIFDLDDNFWDVPFESDPELARYHRLPLRIQQLERYVTHASLIRVYSPVMKDIVAKLNPKVRLLKAGFDFGMLRKPTFKGSSDKLQIVYATSRIVDNQYLLFSEALKRVLDTYADKVELTIWGCQSSELVGYRGVKFMPLIPDYERFLREFSSHGFDIGLAPLEDTPFHRSKTNTKFRDYGASNVAGIYSNTPVYSSCVQDGVTGILVDNDNDSWFKGIAKLIDDAQLRKSIQKNAYSRVKEEYSQDVVEAEWLQEIEELLSSSTVYSLNATSPLRTSEVLIRADFNGLQGVRFPASSPGDKEPVGKVLLEVRTVTGNLLREASTTTLFKEDAEDKLVFSFAPIANSRQEEFLLKFTSVAEEQSESEAPFWLPNSGYIQMLYQK
jgi:glycosyltransferase involved in cell wall biosynthesis